MRISSWWLVVSSVLLYTALFWYANYFWWCTFLFFVPIFYGVFNQKITKWHGLGWGAGLVIAQAVPVVYTFMEKNYGSGIQGIVFIGTGSVLYFGMYGLCYFWASEKLVRALRLQSLLPIAIVWSLVGTLFFMAVDLVSLWHMGLARGYCLMHPLVVLGKFPSLLTALAYIGKPLVTLLIFLTNALIALVFYEPSRRNNFLVSAVLVFWFINYLLGLPYRTVPPAWLARIGYLPKKMTHENNLTRVTRKLQQDMQELITSNPEIDLIILPESSISVGSILNVPEAFTCWSQKNFNKSINVIFGGYRWHEENTCNTMFWINDGKVKTFFDKFCLIPLFEGPGPEWMEWFGISRTKFCPIFNMVPSGNERNPLPVFDSVSFIPYICSELYLDHGYGLDTTHPLLVILNETSLPVYYQDLMFDCARMRAIEWQHDIVYVSYNRGAFLGKNGELWPLQGLCAE